MTNAKAIAIALGLSLILVSRTDAGQPSLQMLLELPQMTKAVEARSQSVLSTEPTSEMAWSNADHVDPGAATVIALIPGFFVHGAGHLYARDYLRGTILLGVQAFSAVWFFKESFTGIIEGDEEGSATGQAIAVSLYFGSWLYDVFRAGVAAEKYNGRVQVAIHPERQGLLLVAGIDL